MKNNYSKAIYKTLICFLLFNAYLNAQTYVLKVVPTKGPSKIAMTEAAEKNKKDRHFKNRMVYISNNDAYYTFIPYLGYRADSLRYKFPNIPSFTYLKEFDVFVEKFETSKKIHAKDEFVTKFRYHATDEFKNYFGKQVQKYVSKNNFYEMYFWVADAVGEVPRNDFIDILEELGLLRLPPNKEVVAMNYLSSEFPMDFVVLEKAYAENINSEIFEEDKVLEEEAQSKAYKTVTNPNEIEQLLGKEYTFNLKRTNIQSDYMFRSNKKEQTIYLSDENSNVFYLIEDNFYALINPYILWGNVDENGDLKYVGSKKAVKEEEEKRTLDLSDVNILHMSIQNGIIDICVQEKNDFWNFARYKIEKNVKEYENHTIDLVLPDKKITNVLILEEASFRASYNSNRSYEYSLKADEIQPLKTKKTYVIKK